MRRVIPLALIPVLASLVGCGGDSSEGGPRVETDAVEAVVRDGPRELEELGVGGEVSCVSDSRDGFGTWECEVRDARTLSEPKGALAQPDQVSGHVTVEVHRDGSYEGNATGVPASFGCCVETSE